ncbi:hypothetical protein ACGF5M_00940 [Gemmatimonadota bacterium]
MREESNDSRTRSGLGQRVQENFERLQLKRPYLRLKPEEHLSEEDRESIRLIFGDSMSDSETILAFADTSRLLNPGLRLLLTNEALYFLENPKVFSTPTKCPFELITSMDVKSLPTTVKKEARFMLADPESGEERRVWFSFDPWEGGEARIIGACVSVALGHEPEASLEELAAGLAHQATASGQISNKIIFFVVQGMALLLVTTLVVAPFWNWRLLIPVAIGFLLGWDFVRRGAAVFLFLYLALLGVIIWAMWGWIAQGF